MLCCIGDLVEDVVVWLSCDIATGTDTDVTIHRRRGGSAANVAVAAASIGARVRFIGRVGSDAVGGALIDDLQAAGVDPVVQREGRTGTIVVLVDESGERSMLPDRAAAVDLDRIGATDLAGVTWLHVPAYSLVTGSLADTSKAAIERVRANGGSVSIDVSSMAIINEYGVDAFRRMLTGLEPEIVLCNQDEAVVLGVDEMGGMSSSVVTVVKAGPDPAIAMDESGLLASVPAVHLGQVRDTTGAGDAFAAGLITALMEDADIERALVAGHRLAAHVLTQRAP
ncbi:MAG: PfkB family carbohydrate kinase [Acidimicrobiia bacterium]|nr:MAG: PfkB family carbohydrate kinase [Acidimicrobiia bacterium]